MVSGSLRATDSLLCTTALFKILNAPTSNGGTTYGPGTSGHVLFSGGSTNGAYWGALPIATTSAKGIMQVGTGLSVSSGTVSVTKPIYVAIVNSTTYADIKAAYDAGYLVMATNSLGGSLKPLYSAGTNIFYFSNVACHTQDGGLAADLWSVNSSGWTKLGDTTYSHPFPHDYTLAAGSWSNATPSTLTVSGILNLTTSRNIVVGISTTATAAQYLAAAEAMILCTGLTPASGSGSLTFTAFGTVPTIDIPITTMMIF